MGGTGALRRDTPVQSVQVIQVYEGGLLGTPRGFSVWWGCFSSTTPTKSAPKLRTSNGLSVQIGSPQSTGYHRDCQSTHGPTVGRSLKYGTTPGTRYSHVTARSVFPNSTESGGGWETSGNRIAVIDSVPNATVSH